VFSPPEVGHRVVGAVMFCFSLAFFIRGDWSKTGMAVAAVACFVIGVPLIVMHVKTVVDGASRTFTERLTFLFIPVSRTRLGPGDTQEVRVVLAERSRDEVVQHRKVEVVSARNQKAISVKAMKSGVDAWNLAREVAELLGVPAVDRTGTVAVTNEPPAPVPGLPPAPAAPLEAAPRPTAGKLGRVACLELGGGLAVRVGSANALDMNLLRYVVATAIGVVAPLAAIASQTSDPLLGQGLLICMGFIAMPIVGYFVWGLLRLKTRWLITAGPATMTFKRTRFLTTSFTFPLEHLMFELNLDPTMSAAGAKRCVLVHAPRLTFAVGTGLDVDELGFLLGRLEGLVAWRLSPGRADA
jgi:hypothetical protein